MRWPQPLQVQKRESGGLTGDASGGGLWCPEAPALATLRRNIDRRPQQIKQVLLDEDIRKQFLSGIGPDATKAVKGFAKQNSGNALKTKPKVSCAKGLCSDAVGPSGWQGVMLTTFCDFRGLMRSVQEASWPRAPLLTWMQDHENIELLRLRNFTLGAKLQDDEVLGADGLERISAKMKALVPFVS